MATQSNSEENMKAQLNQVDTPNYVAEIRQRLSKLIDVEDDLLDLYTLLALTRGKATTWRDVHDAWAVWRNNSNPQHKSLVPFDDLAYEVQELDDEYTKAIIAVSDLEPSDD